MDGLTERLRAVRRVANATLLPESLTPVLTHDADAQAAAVAGRVELGFRLREFLRPAAFALRSLSNWLQFVKFCVVGASGYFVNLVSYAWLLEAPHVHFLLAAVCSFLVAVVNNYVLNRAWTFRTARGHIGFQGLRYLTVSAFALGGNLGFLALLVAAGLDEVPAQAAAIVVVTPISFLGNKLWSFRS